MEKRNQNHQKLRVAVIGSGVAGIMSSYLLQESCEVTLFEKNDYVGGHTNTITIPKGPDEGVVVDTGFIVLNNWTYPHLHKFLQDLKVGVRNSDMSFGYYCKETNLQYAGTNLNGLLAQRANLVRPRFLKMVFELLRFNQQAKKDLKNKINLRKWDLKEYLKKHQFEDAFIQDYLIPISSAIWSTSCEELLGFPIEVFLHFLQNHGLLNLFRRPQWQTVIGGSFAYVKAFLKQFPGEIILNSSLQDVRRTSEKVCLTIRKEGQTQHLEFDRVIFATHADQVLPLLSDPSKEEQQLFGVWKYQKNHTLLHTDVSILPPNQRAWASWNVIRENNSPNRNPVSITYDMNRLQGLKTKEHYLVSLNLQQNIQRNKIIKEIHYMHPTFTLDSLNAREKIKKLNGSHNTYFVGSYFGYGFHEDAVRSSVEMVAKHFGINNFQKDRIWSSAKTATPPSGVTF